MLTGGRAWGKLGWAKGAFILTPGFIGVSAWEITFSESAVVRELQTDF
jgi:hypothetical protein